MTKVSQIDNELVWRLFLFLCLAIIIFSGYNEVLADTGSDDGSDPIGTALCRIVGTLQGNVAKAIATIAIFTVGGGLLMGKLQWQVAMTVIVGIIIIFSAGTIVKWIGGSGTTADVCSMTT